MFAVGRCPGDGSSTVHARQSAGLNCSCDDRSCKPLPNPAIRHHPLREFRGFPLALAAPKATGRGAGSEYSSGAIRWVIVSLQCRLE